MRNLLSIILLCIVTLINVTTQAFAENYNYKLYNPKTHEAFPTEMITMGTGDEYIIGLSKALTICEITTVGVKEGSLLGGTCTDINNHQTYSWKEYRPNTFNIEVKSIIEEMEAQGKKLDDRAYHVLSNLDTQKPQTYNTMPSYWNSYMADLQRRIKLNWTPPQSAKSKNVEVLMKIAKDGRLLSCDVSNSSSLQAVDKAALEAVKFTAPFKPLPYEYKAQYVDIKFTFDYNVIQQQISEQYTHTKEERQESFDIKDTKKDEQIQEELQRQEQERRVKQGFYSSYAERNKYVSEKVVAIYDKRSPAYGYRYILYSPIGKYVGHHKIIQRSPNGYGFDGIPEGVEGCNENSPVPCFRSLREAKHYYYPQWY